MKKLFIFLLLIGLAINAYTQESYPSICKIDVGLMACSQAVISTKKVSELFSNETQLFAVLNIGNEDVSISPYLKLFGDNAAGFFLQKSICEEKKISGYLYADKSIRVKGFDYGVGVVKELGEHISIFAEYNKFFDYENFLTVGINVTGMLGDTKKE